ncbi:MAG: FAD:protein FMN transferase [Lachnospiraceae bacterium]|nr:FAD:protein FMN transferase [Lachnospiraceae bacterium]
MDKQNIFLNYIRVLIVGICIFISLSACKFASFGSLTPVRGSDFYFDTVITVTLYGKDREEYIKGCFSIADHYEKLLSATEKNSDVSKINEAGGKEVTVSDETIELVEKAIEYAKLSDNLFDPTVGELTRLWDFHGDPADKKSRIPDDKEIKKAVDSIGYNNIIIRGNTIALKKGRLDLGGIAKGFIADKMKEYLEENGIKNGIINLGGNILLLGPKDNGDEYTVGIQKPFEEEGKPAFTLRSSNKSIVTSGTYERYFIVNDKLYHHILNPFTGYPEDNDISSVTVITDSSTDADALSTALFLMGKDKALSFAKENDDVDIIIITNGGEIISSSDDLILDVYE